LVIKVRSDITWLRERNIHILYPEHEHYPCLMHEIKRAPPVLYVWGDPVVLSLPQIAIVGSRKPSVGGRQNATRFARGLVEAGFAITSGLALGVDVAAHTGALEGQGKTIAILGTGIDQIYPARHVAMAEQIVATGGAIATEFPLGTGALPSNFPQRNRIISGLACGVLVVEAAVQSGSLITARYALQQDREVYAIPGSIQNPLSRGCHALIKDGAKLVETPLDIIEELDGMLAFKRSELKSLAPKPTPQKTRNTVAADIPQEQPAQGNEHIIMECLGFDPISFDEIAENITMTTGDLMAGLLTLELKGLVANVGQGYCRARH
jgi:DNA processing protein